MKKIFFLIILIIVFISSSASALADKDHNVSIEDVLKEVRQSQNIEQNKDIQCEQITNEQFEELGEALMSSMHPNEEEHELMDQMMGGEGSDSLEARHIIMGQRYLGCLSGITKSGFGLMSMTMGSWPHLATKGGENSMMGFSSMGLGGGWMWLGWIWMILFWGLAILAIVALVRWLTNQGRSEAKGKTALDIIQERYAKGEINKKEFEEKSKDLS